MPLHRCDLLLGPLLCKCDDLLLLFLVGKSLLLALLRNGSLERLDRNEHVFSIQGNLNLGSGINGTFTLFLLVFA